MKKIYLIGCLFLLYAISLKAQEPHKLVKLSNFDPNSYRTNCNGLPGNVDEAWCYSDMWGYVAVPDDPSQGNREYALFAVSSRNKAAAPAPDHGLSIVEITDPLNPVEVAFIELSPAYLRDIKTFTDDDGRTYAYVCSDGVPWNHPQGIAIIELTDLPNNPGGLSVTMYSGTIGNLHNIFIDQKAKKLHMVGGTGGNEISGTIGDNYGIADLTNPLAPVLEYAESIDGIHDIYAEDNFVLLPGLDLHIREYDGFNGFPFNRRVTFMGESHTGTLYRGHDIWLSPDGNTIVYNDEHDQKVQFFLDISSLAWGNASSVNVAATNPETVLRHNSQMVSNDYTYTAHYPLGLKVYELSGFPNNANVDEYGYYDTYRETDKTPWHWNGAFGVWPHFPSSYIGVSDMNYGLYVINECVPFRFSSGVNFNLYGVNSNLDVNSSETVDSKEVMGWAAEETINVLPNIDDGFVVDYDGNVTLTAGESIRITRGFQAINGGKFHAQIGPVCPECSESPPEGEGNNDDQNCHESERAARESSQTETDPDGDSPEFDSERKFDSLRELLKPADYYAKLYPNPASERTMLEINDSESSVIQLDLYDLHGKHIQLLRENTVLSAGRNFISISLPDLASGVYALKITTKDEEGIKMTESIPLTILHHK